MTIEINFDGLVGPTHNYAGLSRGNIASATHAGRVSRPRAAALQGLAKMRVLMGLGVAQGFFPPPLRPATALLAQAGFGGAGALAEAAQADPALFHAACSGSSMWAANAATVLAAADCADGRVHLVTANLATMLHRAAEATETHALLSRVFGDQRYFAVHPPLPLGGHFADEGAANHMRLAPSHGAPGVNVFVHGLPRGGKFPERQTLRASQTLARLAGLRDPVFAPQSLAAIEAGAFHNDVVAVANGAVLLAHPDAFADRAVLASVAARVPGLRIIELDVTLPDAVASYVFNSQLVSLPGRMALILPTETREHPAVWPALQRALSGTDIACHVVDVRESMRNGGGPACLRLRVPVGPAAHAAIHPGYLLTEPRLDALARLVETHWPESCAPSDLLDPQLWAAAAGAHTALAAFIQEIP